MSWREAGQRLGTHIPVIPLEPAQLIPALPTAPDAASRPQCSLPTSPFRFEREPISQPRAGLIIDYYTTEGKLIAWSVLFPLSVVLHAKWLLVQKQHYQNVEYVNQCISKTTARSYTRYRHVFILQFSLRRVLQITTVFRERKLSLQEFEQLLRKRRRKYLVALPSPCSRSYVLR